MPTHSVSIRTTAGALLLAAVFAVGGCGKHNSDSASAKPYDRATAPVAPLRDKHYATFKFIPPELKADLADKKITQADYDAKVAALPLFFQTKTLADLPKDLTWENGMDLPEFADPNAKKGGTYYAAIQDFPRTLRVVGPDANGSFRPFILDDVAMNLARRHPNDTSIGPNGFHYYPAIAKEWACDKKTKTTYVRIDPDARWSDGVPITTDDMMFTFFFYQSTFIQEPWYNNWYSTNYTNITKYDDHTFSITIPELRPDFNGRVLELNPMPEHFFAELGPDYPERYQWRFTPTSGAYMIRPEDVQKGSSIVLTRVKDWWAKDKKFWRGRYNPDRIRFTVIRDTPKAFETFKKGELDTFGLNLAEYWYDKLPDSDPDVQSGYIDKAKFFNDIPVPTYALWMNESMPLLDNRDVRIGIQHATDWQLVIEKYARGDWLRMNTTADGFGEFVNPNIHARKFDIDAALASFAKAGFTKRDSDGVLMNDAGQRLSFTLTTGYEALKDILPILREQALKCGLEFRIEVLDQTAEWKKVQEKKHEIAFTAFNVFPEMYPRYWESWHSVNAYDQPFLPDGSVNPNRKPKPQTNNLCCFANPEVDRLIEKYDRSESAQEMKDIAWRLEQIIYDDASFVPAFKIPFYRNGRWRWVHNPADFNVKISTTWNEYFLFWIDEAEREQTMQARRAGKTFPVAIETFDKFRPRE